jgi:hypothetical protein
MKMRATFLIFSLIVTSVAIGAVNFVPQNVEYYTSRPNILELTPQTTHDPEWQKLNWAQLEFLAQLMGLYPKEHFYFLARDGEYLFDLGLVLTENRPELRERLHLINVSRVSKNSRNLRPYLLENGLSLELLQNKGVVFVDSGFEGSIGKHIRTLYPESVRNQMKIHLIESKVEDIPSSEIFKIRTSMAAKAYELMVDFLIEHGTMLSTKGEWSLSVMPSMRITEIKTVPLRKVKPSALCRAWPLSVEHKKRSVYLKKD